MADHKQKEENSTNKASSHSSSSSSSADEGNHKEVLYLLDYGAGNIRSLKNAVASLGYEIQLITCAEDFGKASRIIFPGVGAFGACMARLNELGFVEPLKAYIRSGKPFFGICIGLQCLFQSSEESPGIEGLGILPAAVTRFPVSSLAVPHIGWNGVNIHFSGSPLLPLDEAAQSKYYYVHSYAVQTSSLSDELKKAWLLASTDYGVEFVAAIQHGNVFATQFHPEKSGQAGLALIKRFLSYKPVSNHAPQPVFISSSQPTRLCPRVIAALDVRSNDQGDIVVTKGDQYDVREKDDQRNVRNLGKPVALAQQYYTEGADEIVFLNITSFRSSPLKDQPMLEVLRQTSENVFVPLTIGGGIRDITDPDGSFHSALEVANEYFRSGADKVSIGTDAVLLAMAYMETKLLSGKSSIETISRVYGNQAVVVSIDPKRQYIASPSDVPFHSFKTAFPGPSGELYCWYPCTINGGREVKNIGAYELAQISELLGAGEIMLNCIDKDGTNSGFDLELIRDIKGAVHIPVIASSGAGCADHFTEVFQTTHVDAALAAGIFHRKEVSLPDVKKHLASGGIESRL